MLELRQWRARITACWHASDCDVLELRRGVKELWLWRATITLCSVLELRQWHAGITALACWNYGSGVLELRQWRAGIV